MLCVGVVGGVYADAAVDVVSVGSVDGGADDVGGCVVVVVD